VDVLEAARGLVPVRRTVRIGVTGLARAGKTALLTSLAANLLAAGSGLSALPALAARLGGRRFRVAVAPAGADGLPRFDYGSHVAALAADPPGWPARTAAVSLLVLDLEIGWSGLAGNLPPRRLRLELLDYPGEWLLDLPLLGQEYPGWSAAVLRRLEGRAEAQDFLAFVNGLPASVPADDALAEAGHRLYVDALGRLRSAGLSMLQPGRFLMPAPGPEPPWQTFFPMTSRGSLAGLLRDRYERYRMKVREELVAPSFGTVDRLVVVADLLSALHAGADAFADAAAALRAVAKALRWQSSVPSWLAALAPFLFGGIGRVAFAASKADHVADRQRGNLAALVGSLTETPGVAARAFAIASVRCTEDVVWTLDGHPVSAVRGRLLGEARAGKSYPGEVPDRAPGPEFWVHPFLALPDFEPMRLVQGGRGGIPHIGLDQLLAFLLEDLL
jgi:predicted YcjX-like family ATPase